MADNPFNVGQRPPAQRHAGGGVGAGTDNGDGGSVQGAPLPPPAPEIPLGLVADDENRLVISVSHEIPADFQLIGNDDAIRHIEEILSQRGPRRNVLLYGEVGVGKTALILGLVQRKNNTDLSLNMYRRSFLRLNTSQLLHSDDPAPISRQFDSVLRELEDNQYNVLVIENIYNFTIHLKARGANAVLISFLEALSRRKMQSIVTCNAREKGLLAAEIPELHEYFAPEQVQEPNNDELLHILRGVRASYEGRYGVQISNEVLRTIRDLTQHYRAGFDDYAQPGRALGLLDRTIARFSVRMNSKPEELTRLESAIINIQHEIQSLRLSTESADVERREELEAQLAEIEPRAQELSQQWMTTTAPIRTLLEEKAHIDVRRHRYLRDLDNAQAGGRREEVDRLNRMIEIASGELAKKNEQLSKINLSEQRNNVLTADHVRETFSDLSGIPVARLGENEREKLLHVEDMLAQRVYGQEEAVAMLADAIRSAKAGLSKRGKPKVSCLFLGPSGVGKTELGKAVAEFLTGSDKGLIRFDMSEYMEEHSVAKFIGAPPGYAGHDEGGQLTEAVRKMPNGVVMFDEIEKAHKNIFRILLQILGDGRLTDSSGNTVSFEETYCILTSNLGGRYFVDEQMSYQEASQEALREVGRFFTPEVIGRFTGVICFQPLGLDNLIKVGRKRCRELAAPLEAQRLTLELGDEDLSRFCAVYGDKRYGGRSIEAALQKTLEPELAKVILRRPRNGRAGIIHARFGEDHKFTLQFEDAPTHPHRKFVAEANCGLGDGSQP